MNKESGREALRNKIRGATASKADLLSKREMLLAERQSLNKRERTDQSDTQKKKRMLNAVKLRTVENELLARFNISFSS